MKTTGMVFGASNRPLSRRLDRCDRVIQNESRDPFGGNVHYVTMQITFLTRKFRNGERNLHCDVVHITTKWVSSLTLDCNGVFAIKAYGNCKAIQVNGNNVDWMTNARHLGNVVDNKLSDLKDINAKKVILLRVLTGL